MICNSNYFTHCFSPFKNVSITQKRRFPISRKAPYKQLYEIYPPNAISALSCINRHHSVAILLQICCKTSIECPKTLDFTGLFDDASYTTRTYCSTTFTDSEGKTLLHSDGMDELDGHLDVIARHAHLNACRKLANAGNVSCSEIELRTIVVEERSVTSTFILVKNVNLCGKLLVASNSARLSYNLSTLDISSISEQLTLPAFASFLQA